MYIYIAHIIAPSEEGPDTVHLWATMQNMCSKVPKFPKGSIKWSNLPSGELSLPPINKRPPNTKTTCQSSDLGVNWFYISFSIGPIEI